MAQSKSSLLKRRDVKNQEALVNLAIKKTIQPIRFTIPSGSHQLLDLLSKGDAQKLEQAVYTWLRGCREFTEVSIVFAAEPGDFPTTTRKVVDFDSSDDIPIWHSHTDRKLFLARALAEVLTQYKAVRVVADKEGISIDVDSSKSFGPTREVTEADLEQWVLETSTDANAQGEPCPFTVGETISNEAWEPYVEFIPKNRSQYGSGTV